MTEITQEDTSPIRIYVANLGKYNEGELVGGWLDLPATKSEIDSFLKNTVGVELDAAVAHEKALKGERVYEEYAIHDWELSEDMRGIGIKIEEWSRIDTLNTLAVLVENADDFALDTLSAYNSEIASTDPIEVASMLAHFANEEHPDGVYSYTKDDMTSDEVAYAEYLLDEVNIDLGNKIKEFKMEGYFDYESYGRDQAMDGYLHNGIYIDGRSDLFEWCDDYDINDIKRSVVENYGSSYYLSDELAEKGWDLDEELIYSKKFESLDGQEHSACTSYDSTARNWETWLHNDTTGEIVALGEPNSFDEALKMCDEAIQKAERHVDAMSVSVNRAGWDSIDEYHFEKTVEQPGERWSVQVEHEPDDVDAPWHVYAENLETGKTGDVWSYSSLEEAMREGEKIAAEFQETHEQRHLISSTPSRAKSVEELAARGAAKASAHNAGLTNDQLTQNKQSR